MAPRQSALQRRARHACKAALPLLTLGAAAAGAHDLSPGPHRPQLQADEAARLELRAYLGAGAEPWRPLAGEALAAQLAAPADFIVDAGGAGTHRTVQAAVDAVPAAGASARRHVIEIRPGRYREPLCVRDKAPLLLRGAAADPAAVHIVEGRWNGRPKAADDPAHPCVPALGASTHGTGGSTSVAIFSDDVIAARLSIANDATEGAAGRSAERQQAAQAVALIAAGDRIQLEQVRLTSHQDTFYARRREPGRAARVFVHESFIAGDVDFVFGNATLVIEASTLHSRADRRAAAAGGIVLAPSTPAQVATGFLVLRSRFTADPGFAPGSVALGRAWDQGVARGSWAAGSSPNGQALVRECELGPHIGRWAASTSGRPFASAGEAANRLAEFRNTTLP